MKFSYYGHSCFTLEINGKKLLFDPFISANELANGLVDVQTIEADYILISHGHQDHILDAVDIAKRTGAKVICAWEVMTWLQGQGVENIHPMNTGGKWKFDDFIVKCTVAQHSSGMPDGTYGGNPMGFLIISNEGNVYYSGDTALTLDMQLIPLWCPDLNAAILPIGDNFTMDYEDALMASEFVQCDNIIGVHFDTFGFIKVDHNKVIEAFAEKGKAIHLPKIGKTIDLEKHFDDSVLPHI
ncbi:MAG: metal-dependent hydrolase [Saprospiraceae bacterium]